MAKQRRARSRPVSSKSPKSASAAPIRRSDRPEPQRSAASERPKRPVPRTGYLEAVALYEQAVRALQHHDYAHAANLLRSVLADYPDEKELHERVRLYLNVCERQAAPRQSTPQSTEERIYAATLAVNTGRHDEALAHLHAVIRDEPDNDHALYMLAVVHALRQEASDAMPHLLRAIALNPENRALARQDPDLEHLRRDESFRTATEAVALGRSERRRSRNRTSR